LATDCKQGEKKEEEKWSQHVERVCHCNCTHARTRKEGGGEREREGGEREGGERENPDSLRGQGTQREGY
jgi:hypothetical protein